MINQRNQSHHGKKKGSLEETISYALHRDDPSNYVVSYRDKDTIKKTSLKDFIESEDYSPIPLTRILEISREDRIVWRKGQKELTVKQ